ncbi:MAG: DUF2612 domain-containing protein, partial [Clostridiales bacterium]|nr:DUF2612 domain-containing protein [Clostridiales bacterium]
MDDAPAFLEKLKRDLLEQFKGKPNIEILQKALARQLEEIYKFFNELNTLRWLQTAEGVQLDGIGDIVAMSRVEAMAVSNLIGQFVPMEDAVYRIYLAYKIHLNTNQTTYKDVYRAIKMFWDKSYLYYSEDLDWPATIFFDTPILSPWDDASALLLAPRVKAAGVQLIIRATTETPLEETVTAYIGGVAWPGNMTTTLPPYLPDASHEQVLTVFGAAFAG